VAYALVALLTPLLVHAGWLSDPNAGLQNPIYAQPSLSHWCGTDRLGRDVPCLVNLMPSGKYLMEDFYYAGGLPVVLREMGDKLHKDALTINGKTI
jgi:hypothetical protein